MLSAMTHIMLDTARLFASELSARAAEGEALRTMPADLVMRLKRSGLFRLHLPHALGGLELDPATYVEVIEELSRADGSAGWTVLIGNSTAFFAWLDPKVAGEMLAGSAEFASTSMWAPLGHAVPEGTGALTLSGRWPFNSGCPHAEWLQVGAFVMDGDTPRRRPDGAPDWRLAFLPRSAAHIEDTWDAAGLRATGSHHLSIATRRVPQEHFAAPFFEPALHEGPLWRIPFMTLAGIAMAGFPLGVGRRALDEFTDIAQSKIRGAATEIIAHDGHVQVELARAEGGLQAARALVFDTIGEIWETVCRGDELTLERRARMLLATNQAMRSGVDAVDRVQRLAGAEAVLSANPLQRCFRDIRAAGQHILFSAARDQAFSKVRFGISQPTYQI
jgi:alkylation response protein AidB-like acyl-CoA dehydrogenase